ncbi:MAG TPA: preprotein translocase subunit YajC [Acidobacteriota bacterium]|nr:preprotein translocase subunit YajC [Acidobacteriota bacterium]
MIQPVLAQQNPSAQLVSLAPILLIFVIFYLLIYRPMRKRQRLHEEMIANLKNGDKVITSGGIYGTIAGLKEHTVVLKVADTVKIEVAKNAVSSLQPGSREQAGK